MESQSDESEEETEAEELEDSFVNDDIEFDENSTAEVFPVESFDHTSKLILLDDNEEALQQKTSALPRLSVAKIKSETVLSSDAESSDATNGEDWQARPASPDYPPEYWQVQRLIKYIKAGNPTATIISLSSLRDFNLRDKFVQHAIKDSSGLEVLLNILETEESRCKRAALLVIREVTSSPDISRSLFNMRGLETLVECLNDPSRELKLLTAEAVSNICKIKKARRAMRNSNGIARLVDMLDIETATHLHHPSEGAETVFDVARSGAMALWSLASSSKNKEAIRKAGAIPLLAKLMKSKNVEVVIPVVGILQECASETTFRISIRNEGLLEEFVHCLRSPNLELVQFCAKAIYMCAEDEESRETVFRLGAIDPLILIIQDPALRKNKPLIAAATGAIWKCATSICTMPHYLSKGLVDLLTSLLEDEPEEILVNVAGAIEKITRADEENCALVKRAGAIPPLIGLLTYTNAELLVNATNTVGELARDAEARAEMEQQDGFRLIWSLLKHPEPTVQASAAWTICPYVESSEDSGDMVRNYVGGLEALVHLLMSEDIEVQAAVSQAIAAIAVNVENLAIMTDHGVVQYLARLAPTPRGDNDLLRRCLATAIAECCKLDRNSGEFGRRKAVSPICSYLSSSDPLVHRAAAKALCALSSDARNCITIHQCGVVPYLIKMSGSLDEELRNSAAGVMANIRNLALSTERVRLM
ncbi:unnamed protein product [Allacma fusca]|uniref:Armadillo repeat-containing protein 4 n=1 Tax=Allacma fusca TaxID=39272 RepID=A0A8J2KYA7_9HEXA|nr:unnamed protein product [Allacma fusca]